MNDCYNLFKIIAKSVLVFNSILEGSHLVLDFSTQHNYIKSVTHLFRRVSSEAHELALQWNEN